MPDAWADLAPGAPTADGAQPRYWEVLRCPFCERRGHRHPASYADANAFNLLGEWPAPCDRGKGRSYRVRSRLLWALPQVVRERWRNTPRLTHADYHRLLALIGGKAGLARPQDTLRGPVPWPWMDDPAELVAAAPPSPETRGTALVAPAALAALTREPRPRPRPDDDWELPIDRASIWRKLLPRPQRPE